MFALFGVAISGCENRTREHWHSDQPVVYPENAVGCQVRVMYEKGVYEEA